MLSETATVTTSSLRHCSTQEGFALRENGRFRLVEWTCVRQWTKDSELYILGCELRFHQFDKKNQDTEAFHIHPASRGVAAHTAGLFRSVRGANGGFPPWGLPKLRIFTFPPVGAPQATFPPRGGSPS